MYTTEWTIDKIKLGFEKFMSIHGRFPTAREIDAVEYLPACRTIQRSFGGLEVLRTQLNMPVVNFSKGDNRSRIAKEAGQRGQQAERKIYELLMAQFGEMFVHIERPFTRSSKQRLDFYVYTTDGNFGVDVFYPKETYSMTGSLNIKNHMYKSFQETLYLVVANELISQQVIGKVIDNKILKFNNTVYVVSIENFSNIILSMNPYKLLV